MVIISLFQESEKYFRRKRAGMFRCLTEKEFISAPNMLYSAHDKAVRIQRGQMPFGQCIQKTAETFLQSNILNSKTNPKGRCLSSNISAFEER